MKRMWLGAPEPSWLLPGYGVWDAPEVDQGLGLCVSAGRLRRIADRPDWARPRTEAWAYDGARPVPWVLDSGAFTEIKTYGRWRHDALDYTILTWFLAGIDGGVDNGPGQRPSSLTWAAPQDMMCEPQILAVTGLTVRDHLEWTVRNLLDLRHWWQGPIRCPFIPVVQGWSVPDYALCLRMYEDAGVDLGAERIVGVGSVCTRQSTGEIRDVVEMIAGRLGHRRLHGFGVSTDGLRNVGHLLESADSQAWSLDARHTPPEPECGHRACTNCSRRAIRWWRRQQDLINRPEPPRQLGLFDAA